MAPLSVVSPDPGHAPYSSASRLSPGARWAIGVVAALALAIGGVGLFVTAHWSFLVLALLGFVIGGALLHDDFPHDLPVRWFKSKQ